MPPADTAIITALRAFDTNYEKDDRSFRPKSKRDEVEKSIQNRFLDSTFGYARNDNKGERKMNESNSQDEKSKDERKYNPELLKKGLRCDLDRLEMLKRCSEIKDSTEWNEWRKKYPDEDILLQGADLYKLYLKGAFLNKAVVTDREGKVYFFDEPLSKQNEPNIYNKYRNSGNVHLEKANLRKADLENALFYKTSLNGADLSDANTKGADFWRANIMNATFHTLIVDGSTIFWRCEINHKTNFHGVGLNNIRIDLGTKQLLEYNIRRKNWEDWYKEHPLLKWLVKSFWWISDYGISTKRIIFAFFGLALFFAAIYSNIAFWFPPGIVSNFEIEPHSPLWHYRVLVFIRPIYFSVVTMTTLGFGDMYANAQSIWGHILLTFQVILGYVLLGALVTRFAVLFTAGGPAGKFADEKEKEKEK